MGEYLLLNDGDKLKLGVMDDFRYVRHTELAAMIETPEGRISPAVAPALANPATLYRFPFPWEDDQTWDEIGQRDFFAPRIILNATGITVTHRSITQCVTGPGDIYQVNLSLPCPYLLTTRGEPENPREPTLSSSLPVPSLLVIGERVSSGQARTIFGCIYCGVLLSCSTEELARLRQQNQHRLDQEFLVRLTPSAKSLPVTATHT